MERSGTKATQEGLDVVESYPCPRRRPNLPVTNKMGIRQLEMVNAVIQNALDETNHSRPHRY